MTIRLGLTLFGAAMMLTSTGLSAQPPAVTAVPGKPNLLIGAYDLSKLGYQTDEFFLAGTATSYTLAGPPTADGKWDAKPSVTAPYVTRIVVLRPDAATFNGTVLVEWLNVTAGQDTPADWMVAHREMIRRGYAYVAVSAQKVGIEGGEGAMGMAGSPLKKADPARYGSLSHPGDAYSYDMYSQVGGLIKSAKSGGVLGTLTPKRVLAIGESQSAAFLTTYINAVDPLAKIYDGFLVHSRFGSSAAINGARMGGAPAGVPDHVSFRKDLRVPVLTLITETDLLGARLSGYYGARRADDTRLRVWELPGAAHADNYLFGGAFIDAAPGNSQALAKIFMPSTSSPMGKQAVPLNPGMPHHYVLEAALTSLDKWVRSGNPPASVAPIVAVAGAPASLTLDANGLARGGVRTPWVDVPTIKLSGKGDPNSFIGMLAGSGAPFDKATLAKLYPGGKPDYLAKFTKSLDAAIKKGHIMAEDRQEILEIADLNFES